MEPSQKGAAPIIQFAFAQTFFRGKSSIKAKLWFGPKADSYFYILHCAEPCTLKHPLVNQAGEYAVLVQPQRDMDKVKHLRYFCVRTACQSTSRPHNNSHFLYTQSQLWSLWWWVMVIFLGRSGVYLRVCSDAYVMQYIQRIFSVESGLRSWCFLCYLTVWLVISVIIIQSSYLLSMKFRFLVGFNHY